MPQPMDYTGAATIPFALTMQQGLGAAQDRQINAQTMDLRAAQEQRAQTTFGQNNVLFDQAQQDRAAALAAAEAEKARVAQMHADFGDLGDAISTGNYSYTDFAQLALKYPDMANELKTVGDGLSADRKATDTNFAVKALSALKAGQPQIAVDMLEERAVAAENSGDQQEADLARASAALIKADPKAGIAQFGMTLSVIAPDVAKQVLGEGKTVQATVTLDDGTSITTFNDGTKQVSDAAGTVITGQAAIDKVKEAQAYSVTIRGDRAGATAEGTLNARIALGAEAAGAEAAGEQAVVKAGEAFDSLNKVTTNIVNVQSAIDALDAGAQAGAVQKYFPDITTASASLTNAMNKLGLDVIGSVTFGALSEGEMKLAMETAVPRNLDGPQLREWLVSKKAAQEKAAAALTTAAIYLGTPGNTLAGWLKSKGQTVTGADSGSPAGATDPVAAAADDLSKYGAAP